MGRSAGPLPEGMYGIYAELQLHLTTESQTKGTGLVGRIEGHVEHQTEAISAENFLVTIKDVLQKAGMKHVIGLEKNDVTVFDSDEESEQDWDEAFDAAMGSEKSSGGNEWWILVSGRNEDFEFRQDVEFKRKHALSEPPIRLVIRALPVEWGKKASEDTATWIARLRFVKENKNGLKEQEAAALPKIAKYIEGYRLLLGEAFPVRDISQSVSINLAGVDLEALSSDYSTEQGDIPDAGKESA